MPTTSPPRDSTSSSWTTDRIRELVLRRFNKRPCWYQLEAAKAFYAGRDVIGCAPTGAGKTLSFWIPLLMAQEDNLKKILFVISPLNVLAKQNVKTLTEVGIAAIAVAAENTTAQTFADIARGKYEVVVTNPEILMTSDELRQLWKVSSFTRRLLGFVFDEGHCISQWGHFRKHYLAVGIIRYLISDPVPFYVASATLPSPLVTEIRRLLHMNSDNTTQILCSNERPDIALMVRQLSCTSTSFEDLGFLVPHNWQEGQEEPKKFLVFFDDIKAAEHATQFFHGRLLKQFHHKIAWFHSTMSQEYRDLMVERFRKGEVWGLCCTDAFGLGMDIGDVEIVVQYKATCDLCTLWQRFGRAARAPGVQGVGILLVEKRDTVDGRKNRSAGSKRNSGDLPTGCRQRLRTAKASTSENTIGGGQEDSMDVDTSCQPTLSLPDQATWSCEGQARYSKPEIAPGDPTNTKKGKAPGVVPGTAIDDYINLPSYVSCRRLVPQLYFTNNKRIDTGHLQCDPAMVGGCQRCRPRTQAVCCDRCHPDFFRPFTIDPPTKIPPSRRSIIPVLYVQSPQHSTVEDALYRWREQQAIEHIGEGLVRRLGAHILMSEEVIERILACWTHGKIKDVSHLHKETTWPEEWISLCGQSLVDLLTSYTPSMAPSKARCLSPAPNTTHNDTFPSTGTELSSPLASGLVPVPSTVERDPNLDAAIVLHPHPPLPTPPPTLNPLSSAVDYNPSIPQGQAHIPLRPKRVKRCRLCSAVGHNQRTCRMSKKVKQELIESLDTMNNVSGPDCTTPSPSAPVYAPACSTASATTSALASAPKMLAQEKVTQEIASVSSVVASRAASALATALLATALPSPSATPLPAASVPFPNSYQQFWSSFRPRT